MKKTSKHTQATKPVKQIQRPCWEITHQLGAAEPYNGRFITRNNKETLRTAEPYNNRADCVRAIRGASDKPIRAELVEVLPRAPENVPAAPEPEQQAPRGPDGSPIQNT